ncbi:hypothetical protein OIU84_018415, partial [Salix udensis]
MLSSLLPILKGIKSVPLQV